MIQILEILWSKFKVLDWWKKGLLFLPLLIVIVFVCLFTFWKSSDSRKFEDTVNYAKKQVNTYVADKEKQDGILAEKDKELVEKQEVLEKEIKNHEKKASNVMGAINQAVNNNDPDELLRIHRQLNAGRRNPIS